METSPLVLAQNHARKASKADTPTAAIDEHGQAAGQFARAAKDTANAEAFRALKLLEQHHEKLARIIRFRSTQLIAQTQNDNEIKSPIDISQASTSPPPTQPQEKSPYRPESQSFPAANRPPRDVASSIASNLASARGIPSARQRRSGQASSPIVNQQNAEGKILSPPRRSRLIDPPSKARDNDVSGKARIPSKEATPSIDTSTDSPKEIDLSISNTKADESFNRFYTTFENLFSKLSAPLAFAGLPLNPDSDTVPSPTPARSTAPIPQTPDKRPKPKTRATASPEYSRLFSPAALRAIREEPGNTNLGAAESFYVVPTTGGTMPYASILARHGVNNGQPTFSRDSTGLSEDIDEFVDARETPGPPSPLASRGKRGPATASGKTLEELELENSGLRSICDELSRRLWQFEMSSQMSQQALHQSIRAGLKPSAESAGSEAGGKEMDGRVTMLEKEMAGMKRENEKLRGVVGKYRERWERLKEGAKMRRDGTGMKEEGE